MVKDSYKHKGLRKQLVASIREKGITDEAVLEALYLVPRHLFLDSSFLEFAYQDKAFPIGSGQTISQPYTVAYQSQLLEIRKGDKVMEVGTGSGYQACILIKMGAKVFSIERQKNLYLRTKKLLPELGFNPQLFYGDGYQGLPTFAPFDKIIITAGAPEVPLDLLKQLRIGGIMVIPLGNGDKQTMTTITRASTKEYKQKAHGTFSFVPMLSNKARD